MSQTKREAHRALSDLDVNTVLGFGRDRQCCLTPLDVHSSCGFCHLDKLFGIAIFGRCWLVQIHNIQHSGNMFCDVVSLALAFTIAGMLPTQTCDSHFRSVLSLCFAMGLARFCRFLPSSTGSRCANFEVSSQRLFWALPHMCSVSIVMVALQP